MNSKLLTATLGLLSLALAISAYQQSRSIKDLQSQLAAQRLAPPAESAQPTPATLERSLASSATSTSPAATPAATPAAQPAADATPTQRVMRDFADMLENPQMNEMMQASQRATLDVMYRDLFEAYQLSPEEREHLMDLLMARQMFRVETSMKMMGGGDPEETALLGAEMKDFDSQIKAEIDTFLNNADDTQTFEYYESTMQERMSLSGFKAQLAKAEMPLADGADRQLVEIMAKQKKAHTFRSDLADETNYDLSPARFSEQNIEALDQDLADVHAAIAQEAAALLTPDQLEALRQTLAQMRQMQISQIKMAASMFAPRSNG